MAPQDLRWAKTRTARGGKKWGAEGRQREEEEKYHENDDVELYSSGYDKHHDDRNYGCENGNDNDKNVSK